MKFLKSLFTKKLDHRDSIQYQIGYTAYLNGKTLTSENTLYIIGFGDAEIDYSHVNRKNGL